MLRDYFKNVYTAQNLIVSAVGNLEHARVRELVEEKFGSLVEPGEPVLDEAPQVVPKILVRNKELEQSHVCLGVGSYPQNHDDRYSSYVLNTLLGGSMSSRLFQNVREKRGLAYAVFSGLSAYRDAGSFTIYAGCSNEAVGEVIDLVRRRTARREELAGARVGAAAFEGSPEGQPDAEPREHGQPHVAPRAPGDLLRSAVRSGRNAAGHRARDARPMCSGWRRICSATDRLRRRCWGM